MSGALYTVAVGLSGKGDQLVELRLAERDVHRGDVLLQVLDFAVPGIGNMTGPRFSSQARAIWLGAAL